MRTKILLILVLIIMQATTCRQKPAANNCFKGKLEIRAICMNYTISVIEGIMDSSLVESKWTDPGTGKEYRNAFRLASPCNFPTSLKEGDEFYFVIDTTMKNNCAVCQAYYPTPSKSLSIRIIDGACQP